MLKARLNLSGQSVGVEMDYNFHNIKNMTILVRIDNPLEDWSNFYIELCSALDSEVTKAVFGLELYENSLGFALLHLPEVTSLDGHYYKEKISFLLDRKKKNLEML